MKPTKKQIMSKTEIQILVDEFYYKCKKNTNYGVHYFCGFLINSFATIAAHPEKIESEIEIIKEQTQKIINKLPQD